MLDKFEHALAATKSLDAKYPGEPAFTSIIAQLEHIITCLPQNVSPYAAHKEITFGFLGARVVREFDTSLSAELAELNSWLERTYNPQNLG